MLAAIVLKRKISGTSAPFPELRKKHIAVPGTVVC